MSENPKHVFLSYRRGDAGVFPNFLYRELESRFGSPRVFLDIATIPAGSDFVERIENAVDHAAIVLALIGPRWLERLDERRRLDDATDYVFLELRRSVERSVPVFPVLIAGTTMPSPARLPGELAWLARRNALELSDQFVNEQMETIAAVVAEHLGLARRNTTNDRDRQMLDAARQGQASRISSLLRSGAELQSRDESGNTALILAAEGSHAHAVETLLKAGADVNDKNDRGITPLIAAVANRARPLVTKKLLDAGAEVNARTDDGSTALLYAADRGDADAVFLLLDRGADQNIVNDFGNAPVIRALFVENQEAKNMILTLLTKPGAVERLRRSAGYKPASS